MADAALDPTLPPQPASGAPQPAKPMVAPAPAPPTGAPDNTRAVNKLFNFNGASPTRDQLFDQQKQAMERRRSLENADSIKETQGEKELSALYAQPIPGPKYVDYPATTPKRELPGFQQMSPIWAAMAALGAKGNMVTAMNSYAGALKGAQDGSDEIFKQKYEEYKTQMDLAVKRNEMENNKYRMIINDRNRTVQQKVHELAALARSRKDEIMEASAEVHDFGAMLKEVDARADHIDKVNEFNQSQDLKREFEDGRTERFKEGVASKEKIAADKLLTTALNAQAKLRDKGEHANTQIIEKLFKDRKADPTYKATEKLEFTLSNLKEAIQQARDPRTESVARPQVISLFASLSNGVKTNMQYHENSEMGNIFQRLQSRLQKNFEGGMTATELNQIEDYVNNADKNVVLPSRISSNTGLVQRAMGMHLLSPAHTADDNALVAEALGLSGGITLPKDDKKLLPGVYYYSPKTGTNSMWDGSQFRSEDNP